MDRNTESARACEPTGQATLWEDYVNRATERVWNDDLKQVSKQWDVCARKHGGHEFSVQANEKAHPHKDKAKSLILAQLRRENGLSCEMLEWLTGLSHQSCSARVSELKRDGVIHKVGTALTRSGSKAALYKLT